MTASNKLSNNLLVSKLQNNSLDEKDVNVISKFLVDMNRSGNLQINKTGICLKSRQSSDINTYDDSQTIQLKDNEIKRLELQVKHDKEIADLKLFYSQQEVEFAKRETEYLKEQVQYLKAIVGKK